MTKLIPDDKTLQDAYRRVFIAQRIRAAREAAEQEAKAAAEKLEMPGNIAERLRQALEADPGRSWDRALPRLVEE